MGRVLSAQGKNWNDNFGNKCIGIPGVNRGNQKCLGNISRNIIVVFFNPPQHLDMCMDDVLVSAHINAGECLIAAAFLAKAVIRFTNKRDTNFLIAHI